MINKFIEKIKNCFNKCFKKFRACVSKLKNDIRVICKDPLERYVCMFLLAFMFAILIFFFANRNKNRVRFTIQGKVSRVKDGDTFAIGDKVVNLYGVDAPELKQQCEYYNVNTKKYSKYSCGEGARRYLKQLIRAKYIKCDVKDEDKYGRFIAVCYVKKYDKEIEDYINGFEVNRDMVAKGYAVAYTKYSKRYVKEEHEAKKKKLGIWNGKFMKPEKYRKKN